MRTVFLFFLMKHMLKSKFVYRQFSGQVFPKTKDISKKTTPHTTLLLNSNGTKRENTLSPEVGKNSQC